MHEDMVWSTLRFTPGSVVTHYSDRLLCEARQHAHLRLVSRGAWHSSPICTKLQILQSFPSHSLGIFCLQNSDLLFSSLLERRCFPRKAPWRSRREDFTLPQLAVAPVGQLLSGQHAWVLTRAKVATVSLSGRSPTPARDVREFSTVLFGAVGLREKKSPRMC